MAGRGLLACALVRVADAVADREHCRAHTVAMRHVRHRTPWHSDDKAAFWSHDASGLLAELSSGIQGLSSAEAARRLQTEGPNTLDEEPDSGVARLALAQFKSPLVLILVFGGAVSASLRDWLDATIILAVILGSCALGFLQEYRASKAVAQLRKRLALTVNACATRHRVSFRLENWCPATSSCCRPATWSRPTGSCSRAATSW